MSQVLLDVQYKSQWGMFAAYSNNDCGAACVAIVSQYVTGKTKRIDTYSRAVGHKGLVTMSTLRKISGDRGVVLGRQLGGTVDILRSHLVNGRPPICLVSYGLIPSRVKQDQRFKLGHYVVITGVGEDFVQYHDPDFRGLRLSGGKNVRISHDEFLRAWRHPDTTVRAYYPLLYPLMQGIGPIISISERLKMEAAKVIAKSLYKIAEAMNNVAKAIWRYTRLEEHKAGIQITTYKNKEKATVYTDPEKTEAIPSAKEFVRKGFQWVDVLED